MMANVPKRADLPTPTVLEAVATHGRYAIEHLLHAYPEKVILAAYRRDAGYLDYGTSERRPWLTPEGKRHLRDAVHDG